mmetsp:Transcript_30797/g.62900  ORF Transcript_30797/g.62900 Transcript_30797/m.62900 type:complete len:99 (+) Transcript_30797:101-397(+)
MHHFFIRMVTQSQFVTGFYVHSQVNDKATDNATLGTCGSGRMVEHGSSGKEASTVTIRETFRSLFQTTTAMRIDVDDGTDSFRRQIDVFLRGVVRIRR